MNKFIPKYEAGSGICGVMAGLGYLSMAGGVMVGLSGASGPPAMTAAAVGVGMVITLLGLLTVGFSQLLRSMFDAANSVAELVHIERRNTGDK